jgi:SPOR domain
MRRGGHLPEDGASGDPLAELARLIGQSDPFSDYGRRDGRNPPPREAQSGSDWRRQAASMPPYDAPEEAPRAPSRSEPRFSDSYSSRDRDPYRAAEEPQDARLEPRVDPRYDSRYEERPSQYRREPQFEDESYDDPRQDERMYDARDQRNQPAYFEDGAPLSDEDDDAYDDPPRSRGRGGLLTAVTLIGCAMIGTAGAYGYRTYYSSPSSNRVPPVISADTTPTKVVSAEGPTGKSIQDRVRDTAERVVPREEEPLEIRTPSSSRSIPGSGFPTSSSGGSNSGGSNAFAPPSGNGSDSKRVRTLSIRPDAETPSREPPSREPPSREPASREAPSRTASNNPPPSAAPPRPVPVPKTPSRNAAPISLDPQETAAPPAPRERTAAVAPPATTQSLQPPAPRASEGSANGYSVQLSSQRSEAEAQASYRSLQSKFPDQLSDRSVMIKRADLGAKGIYYRALVGPFASSDEATQFCSELKAAGGQCLIQRN